MSRRQMWIGVLVMIAVLLVISAVPGHADRGGHGYKGHGYKGHGHGGHGHRGHWHKGHGHQGSRVFISPRVVVPFGVYGRPYWEPYSYPPVVDCTSSPGLCRTLAASAHLLVLLRRRASLLPVCPRVPRRVAAGVAGTPRIGGEEPVVKRWVLLWPMIGLLSACAAVSTGPSVMVWPGVGKPFDQFQVDDMLCRQYAQTQTGVSPGEAGTQSTVNTAALGTLLGARAGAAIGAAAGNAGLGAAIGGKTRLAAIRCKKIPPHREVSADCLYGFERFILQSARRPTDVSGSLRSPGRGASGG